MVNVASPIPEEIRSSEVLAPLVERAEGWINEVITPLPVTFDHEWYTVDNIANPPTVGVRVSNSDGDSAGIFSALVLSDKRDFIMRFIPLLHAVNRRTTNIILNRLREMRPVESE